MTAMAPALPHYIRPYTAGAPQTVVLTAYYFGGSYELTAGVAKKYYCEASRSEAEWTPSAGRQ